MTGMAITLGGDTRPFEAAMKAAVGVAAQTSGQILARYAAAATGIDKAFTATARRVGLELGRDLVSAVSPAALAIGGLTAGFLALTFAIKEIDRAADAARERLAELVKLGNQALSAGVGTTFLQSLTGQAKALNVEVSSLTAMLERAREASTIRIAEGDGTASSAIEDRLRQNVRAGNLAQGDLNRFTAADSQESRIRVILDLIEQLRSKGAQLAALDLAGKMFGTEFEAKLRSGTDMIGAMRSALDGLTVGADGRIIPPEEIQRAQEMDRQLREIGDKLANALKPIQEDIAYWEQQQLQGWIDIKSQLADIVVLAGQVYSSFKSVGQYINSLGNAQVFADLNKWLDSYGLLDKSMLKPVETPVPNGGVPKDADAGGPLIIRPKADTSRALPSLAPRKSQAPSQAEISAIETFVGSLEKSAAAIRAETEAYGRNSAERAIAINMAKAEEVAKQAGIKLTEAQVARIREASTASAEFRDRLDDLREQQEFARSAGGDFLQGFAADMREGVSVTEALSSALNRLSTRLQDRTLDQLADTLFGKSGGNSGGLFDGLSFAGLLSGGSPTGGVRLFADGVADLDVPAFASGGVINGPGTGTSDSIIARVSKGESIIPAKVTAKHLPLIRALVEDRLPRFAEGQVAMAVASLREPTLGGAAYDAATSSVQPAKIDQRKTFKIDARGAQVGVAEQIVSALKDYDRALNMTMGQRMDNWHFNNALVR